MELKHKNTLISGLSAETSKMFLVAGKLRVTCGFWSFRVVMDKILGRLWGLTMNAPVCLRSFDLWRDCCVKICESCGKKLQRSSDGSWRERTRKKNFKNKFNTLLEWLKVLAYGNLVHCISFISVLHLLCCVKSLPYSVELFFGHQGTLFALLVCFIISGISFYLPRCSHNILSCFAVVYLCQPTPWIPWMSLWSPSGRSTWLWKASSTRHM